MKRKPVVHFEIPYKNPKRMGIFYSTVFGWGIQVLGPDMGNYVLATTTDTDKKRMVKTPGTINGGFYEKSKPDEYTRLTIAVDDIKKAMKQVKKAGGKVLGGMRKPGEPDEIPGVGLYAVFIDTEGNALSLLQPTSM